MSVFAFAIFICSKGNARSGKKGGIRAKLELHKFHVNGIAPFFSLKIRIKV
jgi:hypothetical protein